MKNSLVFVNKFPDIFRDLYAMIGMRTLGLGQFPLKIALGTCQSSMAR